jgi:thymidylate synthase
MNKADYYYKTNLNKILNEGCLDKNPRPKYKDGTFAYTRFITQVYEEYDINKDEFPIPTLRNTAIKTGIKEILWIYQDQDSSLDSAKKRGINWWNEWDIGDFTIGKRYGATIKKYDLMNKLLKNLKEDPFSRRHIINMYQESDLQESLGLYPCAYETIWSIRKIDNIYFLDMTLIQRSSDFLTANFINKSQYVSLQLMVCGHLNHNCRLKYLPGKFCHFVQNLHIYDRHIEAANEIINKESLEIQPKIILDENKNFYDYTVNDFEIIGIENITKLKSKLEIAI